MSAQRLSVEFAVTDSLEARLNFGFSLFWRKLDGFGRDRDRDWWGIGEAGDSVADAFVKEVGEFPHSRLASFLYHPLTKGAWPDPLETQLAFVELETRFTQLIERKKELGVLGRPGFRRWRKRALLRAEAEKLSGPL